MRLNRTVVLVTLVPISILVGVGAAAFLHHHEAFGSQVLTGVFAGVLTSGILGGLASLLQAPRLPSGSQAELSIPGLVRVVPKMSLTPEQWLDVVVTARHEFFLAGHTLGRWCGETHRSVFESNILRILAAHGSVRLLTLGPGSPHLERLKRATERDYTQAVNDSREFLGGLLSRLPLEQHSRLTISVLPDHAALPYMLVGNEQTLITATYLSSHDSDDVPCLEIARDSRAAISIYDDFCRLVRQGTAFAPAKS